MSGAVVKRVLVVRRLLFEAGNWMEVVLELGLGLEKVGVRCWWCRDWYHHWSGLDRRDLVKASVTFLENEKERLRLKSNGRCREICDLCLR